jgi:rSAM/selenodomain-associated transferase 1
MKEALIIFVRSPELGKVKTRLAAQIGKDNALLVYKKLLTHTKSVAAALPCDVFIFAADALQDEQWNKFIIEQQSGDDLGKKMLHAFKTVFEKGYKKSVIIGSDCPELSASHVKQAFKILDDTDIVIGPAKDGGYYLLGMKKIYKALFQINTWSTATVFDETIASINASQLSYKELEALTDVDEEKDLPDEWRKELVI